MRTFIAKSEKDTEKFAEDLAKLLEPGDVLALVGGLGAGKTTLTKYIARAIGVEGEVTSPTFTIIGEYRGSRDGKDLPLYHFDVYRIDDPDEMSELGYEEYFYGDGICVVEWADKIGDLLPEEAKVIYMEYGEGPEERIYRCAF